MVPGTGNGLLKLVGHLGFELASQVAALALLHCPLYRDHTEQTGSGDGGLSITQKDACVSSRDGSDIAMRPHSIETKQTSTVTNVRLGNLKHSQHHFGSKASLHRLREGGVKVFGEPCVWCGGGSCDVLS